MADYLIDGEGTPLSLDIASTHKAEVNLIENRALETKLRRLLYDRAADRDPLWEPLQVRQIELACHRGKNRRKPPTGRAL